jgi:hypothetical protein
MYAKNATHRFINPIQNFIQAADGPASTMKLKAL